MSNPQLYTSAGVELADNLPELRDQDIVQPSRLARMKHGATPFLLGAGLAVGVTLTISALRKKRPPTITLFPVPKSTLLGKVAKIAVLAIGRTLVRRAFSNAVQRAASQPA